MARIGLDHLNAGWCDAGWHGSVLTLELKNCCRSHEIVLTNGDFIGQIIFFSHEEVPDENASTTTPIEEEEVPEGNSDTVPLEEVTDEEPEDENVVVEDENTAENGSTEL